MGSVVSDLFDAVGDVFEAVGDVVEDVVDFVGDVVDKVGDVVQAVLDDPLPVLLSVAGSFVGIPPYVTMGALTAARGGDLEDIVLSMGTAYIGSSIAPTISNSISSTVSSTFVEAGLNETFSQVAGDAISKGLVNGTMTEIRGGDFEDGFAGGFIGGAVAGGVTEIADFVKPDIIDLAMDSGLDLRDATSVFNAGVKAVSAGVTSEITGKNDFATSFTASAIGSGVDAGVRSFNTTIDEQFNTVATVWNEDSKDGEVIDTTTVVGAGIPDGLVSQVAVSDIGVNTEVSTSTFDAATILGDTVNQSTATDSAVTADTAAATETTPEGSVTVTQAPAGETYADFEDLLSTTGATSNASVLAETPAKVLDDVADIEEDLNANDAVVAETIVDTVPTGGLATASEVAQPVDLSEITQQDAKVVSDAPVSENLITSGIAQDQPTGGLNAVSTATQDKPTNSTGFKVTDVTKPLVATVGSLVKSTLTRPKTATRPTTVRPTAVRPAGGLQTASVKPKVSAPPVKVNVANLIPIQKEPLVGKPTKAGPAKTLASTANLTPVSNIAGLTSLVKKTG